MLQLADAIPRAVAAIGFGAAPKPDRHGVPHLYKLLDRPAHRYICKSKESPAYDSKGAFGSLESASLLTYLTVAGVRAGLVFYDLPPGLSSVQSRLAVLFFQVLTQQLLPFTYMSFYVANRSVLGLALLVLLHIL